MRTVYLGTSPFAVTVLERLARSPHRPTLVVTRPDARQGRGRSLSPPPVALAATQLGIPVAQPASVNDADAVAQIAAESPDTLVVCAYGGLVGDALLAAHRPLNIHPSLLPRWRGAAPIERALMEGDDVTGVCVMELVAALDAGPVLARREEPIGMDDTFGSLSARLAATGAELLVDVLDDPRPGVPQTDAGLTYADKLTAADRALDPTGPARREERRVHALTPHVGARLRLPGDQWLGIADARAVATAGLSSPEPGALARAGDRLLLGCADGPLELIRVRPPGGGEMEAADFLRGAGSGLVPT